MSEHRHAQALAREYDFAALLASVVSDEASLASKMSHSGGPNDDLGGSAVSLAG